MYALQHAEPVKTRNIARLNKCGWWNKCKWCAAQMSLQTVMLPVTIGQFLA